MNCLDGNWYLGFFFSFLQHSKRLVLGSAFWCWIGATSTSCNWGQQTIRGTAPPCTLWPNALFWVYCVVTLALRSPEYCLTLSIAQSRCRPRPSQRPLSWASKTRYQSGMRLPQKITLNQYRSWVQDSTRARSFCEEFSCLWFCASLTTSTGLFQYWAHKVTR